MGQKLTQVDAFTGKPFSGNPAAVCVLKEAADEEWMRNVAREMNLSETAFLFPHEGAFNLRWFTPTVEVALCGHATLASAHVLWEEGYLARDQQARFRTKSGLLTAELKGDWIELDLPAVRVEAVNPPPGLIEALGIKARCVGKNKFDYLLEVESEETVRNVRPNNTLLRLIEARGVIITSRSATPQFDFVSRFFAPGSGIDEDPVTGSAHCALGPYWGERLQKREFVAYQASPRGGVVRVRVEGDRVRLAGQAVTVLRGELLDVAKSGS
jgi:PhzF family phenazine biosynthesis protein